MRALIAAAAALILTFATALVIAFTAPAPPAPRVLQSAPSAAAPGLVWHSGGLTVRLTDRPCPFEDMALDLETDGVPPARAYVVTQGERKSTGCWARDMSGDVLTRTPDGQEGTIPLDWFRSEPAT